MTRCSRLHLATLHSVKYSDIKTNTFTCNEVWDAFWHKGQQDSKVVSTSAHSSKSKQTTDFYSLQPKKVLWLVTEFAFIKHQPKTHMEPFTQALGWLIQADGQFTIYMAQSELGGS